MGVAGRPRLYQSDGESAGRGAAADDGSLKKPRHGLNLYLVTSDPMSPIPKAIVAGMKVRHPPLRYLSFLPFAFVVRSHESLEWLTSQATVFSQVNLLR